MLVKDLCKILNKINDAGFGDVELYTYWDDDPNKLPEFNLFFNGFNETEFLKWFPKNPFKRGIKFMSFSISKECNIKQKKVYIHNSIDVYKKCKEYLKNG